MAKLPRILIALSLPFLIVVGFLGWRLLKGQRPSTAALSIGLSGSSQEVWLGGEKKGTTPFYADDLKAGEFDVKVASWSARLTLTPNALTAVKLDPGPSGALSGEQVFWLEKSEETRIAITSNPEGAEIKINEEPQGASPLSLPTAAGSYTLTIGKAGYQGESLKVQVQPGYKLNAWFKLRAKPVPDEPTAIALSDWGLTSGADLVTLYDFSSEDTDLTANLGNWLSGISSYYASTPGTKAVDFYVTAGGKVVDSSGNEAAGEWVAKEKLTLAYLGIKGQPVSQGVKDALNLFLQRAFPNSVGTAVGTRVKILPTGVGFLRVRSGPGTSFDEVVKINPGEEYPVLAEQNSWYKIRLKDGREGWITGQWAQKLGGG